MRTRSNDDRGAWILDDTTIDTSSVGEYSVGSDTVSRMRVDLDALRRRMGNVAQRELVEAALERGWTERRGRGSHRAFVSAGRRTLIIPARPASGTVRSIIEAIERGADA